MPTEDPEQVRSPTSVKSGEKEDTTTTHHLEDSSVTAVDPETETKTSGAPVAA